MDDDNIDMGYLVTLVLSLRVESGPHNLIRHEVARRLWAKDFRGLEKVDRETFAMAVFDAIEDGLVPGAAAAAALDEAGCMELAVALDHDGSGKITVRDLRAKFLKGLPFTECVALLLAKDGTLSLPIPPKVGRCRLAASKRELKAPMVSALETVIS
jgi:hypothetical protein